MNEVTMNSLHPSGTPAWMIGAANDFLVRLEDHGVTVADPAEAAWAVRGTIYASRRAYASETRHLASPTVEMGPVKTAICLDRAKLALSKAGVQASDDLILALILDTRQALAAVEARSPGICDAILKQAESFKSQPAVSSAVTAEDAAQLGL
jgi:hypothetical protein